MSTGTVMNFPVSPLQSGEPHGSPKAVAVLPFFLLGFGFSLWYLKAYFMGDAVGYKLFYDSLYQMPPKSWRIFQYQHLGSSEPFYAYIMGVAAYSGQDRIVYLSIWNGVLITGVGYSLIKYRCSLLFSALILSNYYLLVILGPAERLKFAYIFLVAAFCIDSMRAKLVLSLSSPFFHAQAIIQFVSGAGYYLASNLRIFMKSPLRTILLLFVSSISLTALAYVYINSVGQSIEAKSAVYAAQSSGLSEAIQWAMLLAGGLWAFRNKLGYFVGMMPMGILTVLFGNRVNVATFALFVALAMLERKTRDLIVLVVMAYMSFKSIGFMLNVVEYGTGYVS